MFLLVFWSTSADVLKYIFHKKNNDFLQSLTVSYYDIVCHISKAWRSIISNSTASGMCRSVFSDIWLPYLFIRDVNNIVVFIFLTRANLCLSLSMLLSITRLHLFMCFHIKWKQFYKVCIILTTTRSTTSLGPFLAQ